MSEFSTTLLRKIRSYGGQLTSLAKSFAPSHLQKGISSTVEESRDGSYRIRITATGPDAHAQEYGSGLHTDGRVGVKKKYPIFPKPGHKLLAFKWDVAEGQPEKFSFLPDGRVILPSVQHPGIEKYKGRGYIAPAVKEFRKSIKSKEVTEELKSAILRDIKRSFEAGKNG